MNYIAPPIGTEDDTYHWIMDRHNGSIRTGLYNKDSVFGDRWIITGFSCYFSPLSSSDWEYLKPVVPYDATP